MAEVYRFPPEIIKEVINLNADYFMFAGIAVTAVVVVLMFLKRK